MAKAPMDMLRQCRDQFRSYAEGHRAKAIDPARTVKDRNDALNKAKVNEDFARQIDDTLRAWE